MGRVMAVLGIVALLLSVIGVYGEPASMSEDARYLEFYAEQGFDLVFAIGYLMKSSLEEVAAKHPETAFAIIDDVVDLPNVASVTFKEHEGSYVVGALAGRKSQTGKAGVVLGRLRNAHALVRASRCYVLHLGRDSARNAELVVSLAGHPGPGR